MIWQTTYGLYWYQWFATGIVSGGIVATAAFWFGRYGL